MASEVMLVCKGGRLLGPFESNSVSKAVEESHAEVDFVITPEKGWMPLESFVSWQTSTSEPVSAETALHLKEPKGVDADKRFERAERWLHFSKWVLIVMALFSMGWIFVWLVKKYL